MKTCLHEWREKEYIRSDGSGFDRCRICGKRREIAGPAVLVDLTDAELNTFEAVTNQYLEQDSELRKEWGVLPRIIAELRRRRDEAQRIPDYGWQCGRCGEQQPILLMPPLSERCKGCGAPMCETCRVSTSYCCDSCASD